MNYLKQLKWWHWTIFAVSFVMVFTFTMSKLVWRAMPDFDMNEHFDMPVFDLRLDKGSIDDVTQEKHVDAKLSVKNSNQDITNVNLEIRGRGYTSWARYEKKGYKIKFDTDQGLLGHTPNKHWVLVAEGTDPTLMRNMVGLNLAKNVFTNIEYSSSTQLVELFVNKEYRGVYQLLEHVRVGEDRIDIPYDTDTTDTGYLIEYRGQGGDYDYDGIDIFRVPGLPMPFEVHSPDPEDYIKDEPNFVKHPEQVQYIKDYTTQVWSAIQNKDWNEFQTLCDVPSWVDMYLLMEFTKDKDVRHSSFFLYKKPSYIAGGKMFCGPAWDFNYSMGINPKYGWWIKRGFESETKGIYATRSPIYEHLVQIPEFMQEVKSRWKIVSESVRQEVKATLSKEIIYSKALKRNNQRWGNNVRHELDNVGMRTLEIGNWAYVDYIWKWAIAYPIFGQRFDYKDQIRDLEKWCMKRASWLDRTWSNNV